MPEALLHVENDTANDGALLKALVCPAGKGVSVWWWK